jgi:hypothetical protein
MLRLLVLVLLLANAAYFAWTRNLLAPYGYAPATQSEPQRLAQQIRPEAMRILTPRASPALPASSPAPAVTTPVVSNTSTVSSTTSAVASLTQASATASSGPTECLQAGLFNEEQTAVLRERLQSVLPAGSWVLESSVDTTRWMVYMGKYSSPEALAKKRGELRAINVSFEPLNNPALEPGLSLGNFGSKAEAEAEMTRVAKRGVHTAKVIQTRQEARGQTLKLPLVTPALRPQLDALKPQMAGKPLQTCA